LEDLKMTNVSSKSVNSSPWLMLVARSGLFLLFQALIAVIIALSGTANAFAASSKWWPVSVFLTNLICTDLLVQLFKREGLCFWDIYRINKDTIKFDLIALLLLFPVIGTLGFFPNLILGKLFFGDSLVALKMYIQPLPVWGIIVAVVLFPITQGLGEMPTYFGYSMPRLEAQTGRSWLAVGLAGFFLSIQHVFAPLILDYRFITWRALMFLPLAIATGMILRWRPRLMPYVALIHILMDLSLAPYFLGAI
jgi:hypothetical protein